MDKLEGRLSLEDWQRRTNKWRGEQLEIEAQLGSMREQNQGHLEDGVRALELAQRARSLYLAANYEEKRELLEIMLSNFSFDGVSVEASWINPLGDLAKAGQSGDWLGR